MGAGLKKAKKAAKPKRTAEEARNEVKDALKGTSSAPAEPKLTAKQKAEIEKAKAEKEAREAADKAEKEKAERTAAFAKKWEKWSVASIPVERISVENRYRGDEDLRIDPLAESIAKYGLMTPIGVRDMGDGSYRLVHGGRRLMAIRDKLGRSHIAAVVLDPDTPEGKETEIRFLEMEVEENEQRHNPPMSRKIERFNEITALLKGGGRTSATPSEEPLRKRVAKVVGVSPESKRQADIVFKAAKKDPEKFGAIAESMDKEKTPVHAAFKKVMAELTDMDQENIPITSKKLKNAFILRDQYLHVIRSLKLANTQINEMGNAESGGERLAMLPPDIIKAHTTVPDKGSPETSYHSVGISELVKALSEAMPHAQCPPCAEQVGELGKHYKSCKLCFGHGHIGKAAWDGLVKAEDPSVKKIIAMGQKIEKEKAS